MKVAIYGAGAMGTVLGAYITRAGVKVDMITRNVPHVYALKSGGAHIVGTVDFAVPVSALLPEEMHGGYDLIFLMTKQRENRRICEFLQHQLAEGGAICTMQNGLPEPSVASVIGEDRTLGCAVSWGATFIGEGCAKLTSSPDKLTFSLGSYGKDNPRLADAKEILSKMGEVETVENFIGARWAKLAINSAFSSLSAITGLTFGQVAKGKATRLLALGLLNEAFSVAAACGVSIEKIQGHDIVKIYSYKGKFKRFFALKMLPFAMKSHKDLVSGMYYDLKSHKKSDIDHINGVIVHAARNFDVPVPLNKKVLEIAHKAERGEVGPSEENIKLFEGVK